VFGPGFSTNLLTSLVLAKVPLAMTSSCPRRAPYELKSLASTPRLIRYFAVADDLEMLPAGDMWSVVIESGRFKRQ